jgi:hypothetical protein
MRWCRGVDNSKWTSDLDRSKMALDVRLHCRCGQVDYTKTMDKDGRFLRLSMHRQY